MHKKLTWLIPLVAIQGKNSRKGRDETHLLAPSPASSSSSSLFPVSPRDKNLRFCSRLAPDIENLSGCPLHHPASDWEGGIILEIQVNLTSTFTTLFDTPKLYVSSCFSLHHLLIGTGKPQNPPAIQQTNKDKKDSPDDKRLPTTAITGSKNSSNIGAVLSWWRLHVLSIVHVNFIAKQASFRSEESH